MISRPQSAFGLAALLAAGLLAAGCQPPAIDLDNLEPPQVTVAKPLPRMVVDTEEFTAKTDSVYSVEVRARVSGYLTKIFFQEGTEVKKDEPLFLIDPRPYETVLKRDQAQVAMYEARLIRANADLKRAKELLPDNAVAKTDYDHAVADADETKASLESAKAELARAALDVEFTKIHSPIDGQISRAQITVGNLVNSDSTLLTTIVSIDPVYAYFDMAENIFERIQQRYREGKLKVTNEKEIPVWLGLSAETGFPHEGTINFAENRVDPNTGTLRLRGVFPNPKPKAGGRVLMPGMFARVCIPVAPQRPLLLVPEEALGTDQGQKFVYVVNAKNEVEYRRVTPGKQEAGLRAIEAGLHADDQVIVRGMQRARPGIVVKPKFEPVVPADAKPAANAKPAPEAKPAGESHPAAKLPAKAH